MKLLPLVAGLGSAEAELKHARNARQVDTCQATDAAETVRGPMKTYVAPRNPDEVAVDWSSEVEGFCTKTIQDENHFFSESTHPYDNNEYCRQIFSCPHTQYMHHRWEGYDLEGGSGCPYDWTRITYGQDGDSAVNCDIQNGVSGDMGEQFIGDWQVWEHGGESLMVEFRTDYSVTEWGYKLHITCSDSAEVDNSDASSVVRPPPPPPAGFEQLTNTITPGLQTCDDTSRIVGGTEAISHSWPWIVQLSMGCSGSIISDNYILTAAHCCDGYGNTGVTGYFGQHYGWEWWGMEADPQFSLTSAEVIMYPDYQDNGMFAHDICLLRFNENIFDVGNDNGCGVGCISKVCIASEMQAHGDACWVAGWGTTYSGGDVSPVLLSVGSNVFSMDYCLAHSGYSADELDDSAEFCAGRPDIDCNGYTEPGSDSCQGDSGGPFVCNNDGHAVLTGVVSWGYGCAFEGYPGIYASVAGHYDWIMAYLNGEVPTVAPPPVDDSFTCHYDESRYYHSYRTNNSGKLVKTYSPDDNEVDATNRGNCTVTANDDGSWTYASLTPYDNYEDCGHVFSCEGGSMKYRYTELSIETCGDTCGCDWARVTALGDEGVTHQHFTCSAEHLNCGAGWTVVNANDLVVEFSTDYSVVYDGFSMDIACADPSDGEDDGDDSSDDETCPDFFAVERNESGKSGKSSGRVEPGSVDPVWEERGECSRYTVDGTMYSESAHDYNNGENCGQVFECNTGQMRYRFERLEIETNSACSWDWLRLTTDAGYSYHTCNYVDAPEGCYSDWVTVDGDSMLVEFNTDGSVTYWGYKLAIECVGDVVDDGCPEGWTNIGTESMVCRPDDVDVECLADSLSISFPLDSVFFSGERILRTIADQTTAWFNNQDDACSISYNSESGRFEGNFGLGQCGLSASHVAGTIGFSGSIIGSSDNIIDQDTGIFLTSILEFQFRCEYSDTSSISSDGMNLYHGVIDTAIEEETEAVVSVAAPEVTLGYVPSMTSYAEGQRTTIQNGDPIYNLITFGGGSSEFDDTDIRPQIIHCTAYANMVENEDGSLSADESQPSLVVIENGICTSDIVQAQFHDNPNGLEFSFNSFRFNGDNDNDIHLVCLIQFCIGDDDALCLDNFGVCNDAMNPEK